MPGGATDAEKAGAHMSRTVSRATIEVDQIKANIGNDYEE